MKGRSGLNGKLGRTMKILETKSPEAFLFDGQRFVFVTFSTICCKIYSISEKNKKIN